MRIGRTHDPHNRILTAHVLRREPEQLPRKAAFTQELQRAMEHDVFPRFWLTRASAKNARVLF
jgi:hypothetical protein